MSEEKNVKMSDEAMSDEEKLFKVTNLLSKYAVETHWYINSSNKELRDNNDTPTDAFTRCADVEDKLKKLGYIFPNPHKL